MNKLAAILLLTSTVAVSQPLKQGKWLDTTADTEAAKVFYIGEGKLLLTEDYEVMETHEICASLTGFFMEKSNLGRYNISFKGMRTSAQFTFTTQFDAEKWAEKWCTPQSLRSIKGGQGNMGRSY
jgi:hypothetical protein